LVDEQAGFANQSEEQSALDVDEDDRENNPDQRRQELSPISDQRFERETPHKKT
jgi:hypothetical protein